MASSVCSICFISVDCIYVRTPVGIRSAAVHKVRRRDKKRQPLYGCPFCPFPHEARKRRGAPAFVKARLRARRGRSTSSRTGTRSSLRAQPVESAAFRAAHVQALAQPPGCPGKTQRAEDVLPRPLVISKYVSCRVPAIPAYTPNRHVRVQVMLSPALSAMGMNTSQDST